MRKYSIRPYRPEDEKQWVRCRALAFLDTAYFDNVLTAKERYERPAIELVAVGDEQIVGLIDVELEDAAAEAPRRTGTIWHVAVHPDWRRQGIAGALLDAIKSRASSLGITHLEAWTRDDRFVRDWYLAKGFEPKESYLHVWVDGRDELLGKLTDTGAVTMVGKPEESLYIIASEFDMRRLAVTLLDYIRQWETLNFKQRYKTAD